MTRIIPPLPYICPIMTLHRSHDFDSLIHTPPTPKREGEYFVSPSKLPLWLEGQLGLKDFRNNTACLRKNKIRWIIIFLGLGFFSEAQIQTGND